MDEHVSRILRMLEEGKISAAEAEKLLTTLRTEPAPADTRTVTLPYAPEPHPDSASSSSSAWDTPRTNGNGQTSGKEPDSDAKTFDFSWGQRRTFPFDFAGLGRTISETMRKLDLERTVRDARENVERGGRRFQERLKNWSLFGEGEDEPPMNTLGQPSSRSTETRTFTLASDAVLAIDNHWGSILVTGGLEAGSPISLDIEREAWATTEDEAQARLRELRVDSSVHDTDSGAARMEVEVHAPDEWRNGTVQLRMRVPDSVSLRLTTVFGEVRVQAFGGRVDAQAVSGAVRLNVLHGDVRAETISGDIHAEELSGVPQLSTKSGTIYAEKLTQGVTLTTVSGDVRLTEVSNGDVRVNTVSGDIEAKQIGSASPLVLRLETVSGDLKLEDAHGDITFKSVSGDVELKTVTTSLLQGTTVSGDVHVALDNAFRGTFAATTVSGDVEIRLPVQSDLRFTLQTRSGKLTADQAVRDSRQSDNLWTGTLGDGTGTLSVQTLSGDVSLR